MSCHAAIAFVVLDVVSGSEAARSATRIVTWSNTRHQSPV
jgi:hypothetical protein